MSSAIRFEEGRTHRPMRERLQEAVARLQAIGAFDRIEGSTYRLRPEQTGIFGDAIRFFAKAVGESRPSGRIILPPRTGKTVIAGQLIRAAQLTTVYLVPTRDLVEQVARELEAQLPGTLIARHYGAVKELTGYGIVVMTYQILLSYLRAGTLPEEIRRAALVIADEAHRALTVERARALHAAFEPQAVQIALTASPDWNERRQLAHLFPVLIHRMTIPEALALALLAKPRMFVDEVDIDASRVTIRNGDFDEDELGRLLAAGPVYELVRRFRYDDPTHRARGCLVCCKSRAQAYALQRFLTEHRPPGTPAPAVVLGETETEERRTALEGFDAGTVDTIIQVGVLIEGWNAPRCKLLIDLAPTTSNVRATQKFFRPLTKWGDLEALIYLIIPKNLALKPLLPQEILFAEFDENAAFGAEPIAPHAPGKPAGTVLSNGPNPIEAVDVSSRRVMEASLERPLLDVRVPGQVRRLLESHPDFDPHNPPTLSAFSALLFQHPLFKGRGVHLLAFAKVPAQVRDYRGWIASLYPRAAPTEFLQDYGAGLGSGGCRDDVRVLQELTDRLGSGHSSFYDGWGAIQKAGIETAWLALGGGLAEAPAPDEAAEWHETAQRIREALDTLPPVDALILRLGFGLDPESEGELTNREIAEELAKRLRTERVLTPSRIHSIRSEAIPKLMKILGRLEQRTALDAAFDALETNGHDTPLADANRWVLATVGMDAFRTREPVYAFKARQERAAGSEPPIHRILVGDRKMLRLVLMTRGSGTRFELVLALGRIVSETCSLLFDAVRIVYGTPQGWRLETDRTEGALRLLDELVEPSTAALCRAGYAPHSPLSLDRRDAFDPDSPLFLELARKIASHFRSDPPAEGSP